jgi:hypothetical protein
MRSTRPAAQSLAVRRQPNSLTPRHGSETRRRRPTPYLAAYQRSERGRSVTGSEHPSGGHHHGP